MHKQALIDLQIPVWVQGRKMSMLQFISDFNAQVGDTFVVSQKFKDEVRPLLIEIFEKRGVGMTTEQNLMFIVVKDLAGKLSLAWVVIQQRKQMIDQLKEITEGFRGLADLDKYRYTHGGQYTAPPPTPAPEQPSAPPPPPPDNNNNNNNNNKNGTEIPFVPMPLPPTNINDVPIPEPSGIPGELNAQNFVENMINPDAVQRNTVEVPNNITALSHRKRANVNSENKTARRKNKLQ